MLKEMSYVLAIVEHGTASKAAEALFITQPSLSRYVRDLERRLGVQLFSRINNRLVLTHAGEVYVETAKEILSLYNGMQQEFCGINEKLSGRLKLGCAVLRMSYNMPSILKAFITKYPNVDLQLYENYTTAGLEKMLLSGEIDIAVINQRNLPKLHYIPFFEEELLLAVPPTQALAAKAIAKPGLKYPWIDIRLLQNQPYIGLNGEQSIAVKSQEIFKTYNVNPAYTLKVKSVESAFRMTEVGLGSSIIPETVTKIPSHKEPPKLFSFGEPVTLWNLALAYREEAILSTVEEEFINLVKEISKI